MAIERNGKWIPLVDDNEIEVCVFENGTMTKVQYDTKEEAEAQEKEIKEVTDSLL